MLKVYLDAMVWLVAPLKSTTFLDDQSTSKSSQRNFISVHFTKQKLGTKCFVFEQSCTQHNWQQFEDPHKSLQQGLAWVQQWLEEDVCVNVVMQILVDKNKKSIILLWGDWFDLRQKTFSSEEIVLIWDISYKTSSEEVQNLKLQQQHRLFVLEDAAAQDGDGVREILYMDLQSFSWICCTHDPVYGILAMPLFPEGLFLKLGVILLAPGRRTDCLSNLGI